MSVREGLEFGAEIASDTDSLAGLVERCCCEQGHSRAARSDTGGVTSALSEAFRSAGVGMMLMKQPFPSPRSPGACEILGLDFYVANEGKLLAIVSPADTWVLPQ
jgi:hydrogenase expression/formation protein HypE